MGMATNTVRDRQAEGTERRGGPAGAVQRKQLPAPPSQRLPRPNAQPALLQNMDAQQVARGLGWFSIGLGLAELLMPRVVSKLVGTRGTNKDLIRLLGLRELSHGLTILMGRPVEGVW